MAYHTLPYVSPQSPYLMNWLHVSLGALAVYLGVLVYFYRTGSPTRAGIGVALANFLFVLLNLAAPFRGVIDSGYAGYRVGLFDVDPGFMVTLVSGGIVVAALAAACLALRNVRGPGALFVLVVDAALLVLIGLPETISALSNPGDYRIELGEYLQIPGLVAAVIVVALFTVPLLLSVRWAARRARA